jgi:predicted enzyme related to lactoylglutathione lyase
MIKLQKLASVIFFVRELRKTAAWYGTVLGVTPYRIDRDFIGFHLDCSDLGFHRLDKKAGLLSGVQIAYWKVNDIDNTIRVFLEHGATIFRKPIRIPEGGSIAQITDPFGNILGLIEE